VGFICIDGLGRICQASVGNGFPSRETETEVQRRACSEDS
jgi:hypothetical protein